MLLKYGVTSTTSSVRLVLHQVCFNKQIRPRVRSTVEHSVYVHHLCRGAGLGRALMGLLIAEARRREDVHVIVGAIDAANVRSIALHQALGFELVGKMPQVGFKFGRWLDLVFYQLTLQTPRHPIDG